MNRETLNTIIQEINVNRITEHIKWLTKKTPYRISSGPDVTKAAEFICSELKAYGFETKMEHFYTYNSTPLTSSLEVLSPTKEKIKSLPCGHIRSTAPEGEVHDLVYLASEDYQNIDNIDIKDQIILVEVSYAPPTPEKARLLSDHGAAGMICMNWGNDEDVIPGKAIKTVWGNPTEETFPKIPNLIAIGVTRNDGLKLKALCQTGPVKINIAAIAKNEWQNICMPFGILKGNGKSDEFLLVASHLDAWKPGVTCNATGNALTLELCRVLAAHRETLHRDIWVTFWNGHEIAEAAGSTWFVDNHWDELNKRCVNYMHIDSPGMKDASLFEIKCGDELIKFAEDKAKAISNTPLRVMRLKKIGDMSCLGIGIPGICQRMAYTQEEMDKQHGATLGWWNHTLEDGLDKYAPDVIAKDALYTMSFLYNLATVKYLPYDYKDKFDNLINTVTVLQDKFAKHVDLNDLLSNLKQAKGLITNIQRGQRHSCNPDTYNKFMMFTARCMTNVSQTYASKYEQDSYGYYKLSSPLPLLSDLRKLAAHDPASLEYGLIKTQIIRNKNRINDAVYSVIYAAKMFVQQI